MIKTYKILILGASYGSLLGTKLALAGHDCTLVCLPAEAERINHEGALIRMQVRGYEKPVELHSREASGTLDATSAEAADPEAYDLIGLAMQEPQYGAAGVRELMGRIAKSGKPCMSIMNMPPLTYLKRLPGLKTDLLQDCYADPSIWDALDPSLMTLASPDPQAFRPPDEPVNVLQVGLPTNFKVAPFEDQAHTSMLHNLETTIKDIRFTIEGGVKVELPVKLRVHNSIYVPLAKWAMLLAGNYRCIQPGEIRAIREAVHTDLAQTRSVYNWVVSVCETLGASGADMVPFDKYAQAAQGLIRPSSAARAVYGGARAIERVDKLVQQIGMQKGLQNPIVDAIVEQVDTKLKMNQT